MSEKEMFFEGLYQRNSIREDVPMAKNIAANCSPKASSAGTKVKKKEPAFFIVVISPVVIIRKMYFPYEVL